MKKARADRLTWAAAGADGVAEYYAVPGLAGGWDEGGVILHSSRDLGSMFAHPGRCPWLEAGCWSGYVDLDEARRVHGAWQRAGQDDAVVFAELKRQYAALAAWARADGAGR